MQTTIIDLGTHVPPIKFLKQCMSVQDFLLLVAPKGAVCFQTKKLVLIK